MKIVFRFAALMIVCSAYTFAQTYPVVTNKQVQQVPQDSLTKADASNLSAHTTLDDSQLNTDTVSVYGVVMSRVRISQGGPLQIPSLGNGYVFYIADTSASGGWNGMFIRASDTAAAVTSLVTVLDTGMVVKVTGRVTEFNPSVRSGVPANNFSSTTQFEMDLDPGAGFNFTQIEINPLPMKRRPSATLIQISDLFKGSTPQFATGEQWEGCYVEVRNVTVVQSTISNNRMTIVVEDALANRLTVLDDSYYYRVDLSGYQPPAQGAKLTYVRGFIANRYGISPIYPNDIQVASFPPTVTTVRRIPIIPKSTEAVTVTAKVTDTNVGGSVTKAELLYGIEGGALQVMPMTLATVDSAVGTIPPQPNGAFIRYMVFATDNDNEKGRSPQDTTREFNFYRVYDSPVTIRDMQYTPYKTGNTGYFSAVVSLRGVVTADTANLGANFIYIQDGTQPWSGILVDGTTDPVKTLKMGDDVTITGTVGESPNRTRLSNITAVVKNGTAPVPAPIQRQTKDFKTNPGGIIDGDPISEQWESMLVKFQNLTVTLQNSDDPGTNFGEFNVDDGTGAMRVDDIGTWKKTYSNGLPAHTGSILLVKGSKIESLTGIVYYGNSNYKLEPRGASDFTGVVTGVERIADAATSFILHQNYPNPFSAGSYGNPSTTITYEIPEFIHVRLSVFDALGREVTTLVNQTQSVGIYTAQFHSRNLPSGIYYYRLTAGNFTQTEKMVIVR